MKLFFRKEGGNMVTATRADLIKLGFSCYYAEKIFRKCKENLVKAGFEFYKNDRIKRIPVSSIEAVLNISLEELNNEKRN